jgi:hypothetical protein
LAGAAGGGVYGIAYDWSAADRVAALMPLEPFTPDADYCVYCHAVAAGPCAQCGALCCGDCVEVVLRLSVPRAVCRACVADEPRSVWARLWVWLRTRQSR